MKTKKVLFGVDITTYVSGTRKEKTEILNNLVRQTHMHRISIIRAMRRLQMKSSLTPHKRRGRRTYYDHACMEAIQFLWNSNNYCCGENLHPQIPEYVAKAQKFGMWKWDEVITRKVLSISIATLKRRIPKWRTFPTQRGISTTTPSAIKASVPLFEGNWKEVAIGNGQIDTVAHCGGNMGGEFIFSCGFVDVSSGWVQYQAQWSKGMMVTQESLMNIRNVLPFPLVMLHPDCGTEFLNRFVMDWCKDNNIEVTRSRSYHKNDNGYIEQRNDHVVRKWFKYERLDHKELLVPMNDFYLLLGIYSNHFQAQRLCIGTKVSSIHKVRKVYEPKGKTPYERVFSSISLSQENIYRLQQEHEELNPYVLIEELRNKRDAILELNRRLTEERGN